MRRTALLLVVLVGCAVAAPAPSAPVEAPRSPPPTPLDVFERYLEASVPIADGFDLPIGDGAGGGDYVDAAGATHHGWYVATRFGEHYSLGIHPGEDWNGRGGGNTDLGQPVKSMGAGRVLHAKIEAQPWGGVVTIEHLFYEAGARRTVVSQYAHLATVEVQIGADVSRGQRIGTVGQDPDKTFPAHLHFELRAGLGVGPTFWPSANGWNDKEVGTWYLPPSEFIAARRSLFVPPAEDLVVLLHQDTDAMAFARKGVVTERYQVGWGQVRGPKEERGDLKTPRGMYFVTSKARGEFPGEYGAFYGGHWLKVNYPGPQDAERGLAQGWISATQAGRIRERWGRRELTPQDTRLGGGIGLHGWIEEWEDHSTRLRSWGCVVLHNRDITSLYDQIPQGTMVVMLD